MGEWSEIPEIIRLGKRDASVWATTFLLTVFVDLTVAVEFGMIIAALTFIGRVALTTTVSEVTDDYLQDKQVPPYATIFRIHGPFLFGSTDKLEQVEHRIPELPPVVILRLRNMTAIDATGIHPLDVFADKLKAGGRELLICGAPWQPLKMMKKAAFDRHVEAGNICESVGVAIERAAVVYARLKQSA